MTDWTKRFQDAQADIENSGKDYALKKARSWQLQKMESVILASLMNDMEGPISSKEIRAKSSKQYVLHIEGTAVAIEEELTAKARYEKAVAVHESLRSLISLDKKLDGQS
jgi:hypothetical protein